MQISLEGTVVIFFFFVFFVFSTGLHRRSSTEILPDYWGTFCAGVCPQSVFLFLVAAGFEPTSLSLRSGCLNRYPILTPKYDFDFSRRDEEIKFAVAIQVPLLACFGIPNCELFKRNTKQKDK